MCAEQPTSIFDFIQSQEQLRKIQSCSNIKPLLQEAILIRKQSLEPLSDDEFNISIGLKRSRGIWTPINYDKRRVYKIPVTMYSSNKGAVVCADENNDLNRAIYSVTQLEPESQAVKLNQQALLKAIEEGKFKNIAVMNAHGEDTFQDGIGYWGYYGEEDEPRMVFKAVQALSTKHDLIILAVCNPGRIRLPDTCTNAPVFYSLGSINAVGDVPNSLLSYVGPEF